MNVQLIVNLAFVLSIFLLVFSLSLKAREHDLFYLFRHAELGVPAALAIFVIVPIFAVLICLFFDLKPATKIAIVALAVSPIPPILPRSQMKAGGHAKYVTGLFVLSTILSIFLTPIALSLASGIFDTHAYVSMSKLVTTLLLTCGLPLIAGIVIAPMLGRRSIAVSAIAQRIGGLLLICALVVILFLFAPRMWAVLGDGTLVGLIAISLIGLVAGSLLGGPDQANRITLAMAAACRHPGIAIAVAASSFPEETLAPAAIILGTLIGTAISALYIKMLYDFGDVADADGAG